MFGANAKAMRKLAARDKVPTNVIVSKDGKMTSIKDDDGMYTYPIRIKKPKNARGNDPMDVGNVNEEDDLECGICEESGDFEHFL